MKDFHEMSADEIKDYRGPVYRAHVEAYRPGGFLVPHDLNSTTAEGLNGKIRRMRDSGWRISKITEGPHTTEDGAPTPRPFSEWTDAELADYLEMVDPGHRKAPRGSWSEWASTWGSTRMESPGHNGVQAYVVRTSKKEDYVVLHRTDKSRHFDEIPVTGHVRAAVIAALIWLGLPIPD
jgi:hypothetical protein